jgi:hypothetical protein
MHRLYGSEVVVAVNPLIPYIVMLALRPTGCVWYCRHKTLAYTFGMLYGNTALFGYTSF